ncbi:SMP-30/gluconolactonase/LRE family protein [Hoyosella altamirensis]|uniref:Sugar lactone lactonase YvrE n=1 Tax=Hoyosella altamirensis TaxID=616997 RepID=A0A839RKE7_9ACTN|nr:SMP-30/gluconolactonase/LRE family protein [Hoyosella altamirensis]MBB3036644.1 sugar lactone lactonase YvrE [Hoyosella altamirensis]
MDFSQVRVIPVPGQGPEDILIDDQERIYTGLLDGRIVRIDEHAGGVETIASLPGRPLGIEFFGEDELVVCASDKGLLRVEIETGNYTVLTESVDGVKVRACNNAAVASDGTIYFSDSSTDFDIPSWRREMILKRGSGRLIRRDLDGSAQVIADGLQFANGVALSADETTVFVAETTTRSLRKVSLTGTDAGAVTVVCDDLPGYPDNCSTGSDGLIWIALPNPEKRVLSYLHQAPVLARTLVSRLPESLMPGPSDTVAVVAVNDSGEIVRRYAGAIRDFPMLTSVREYDGRLWFGSLEAYGVATAPR